MYICFHQASEEPLLYLNAPPEFRRGGFANEVSGDRAVPKKNHPGLADARALLLTLGGELPRSNFLYPFIQRRYSSRLISPRSLIIVLRSIKAAIAKDIVCS